MQLSLLPPPESEWTPPAELPDLSAAKRIGLDVETFDPNLKNLGPGGVRGDGHLLGVSLCTDDRQWRGYIPIRHEDTSNFNMGIVRRWLNDQLGNPKQAKVGANLPYDLEWLRHEGVHVKGPLYDVQVAEPLIDENAPGFALEKLGKRYLDFGKREDLINEAIGHYWPNFSGDTKAMLHRLPARYVGPYAEVDAELPLRIFEKQEAILKDEDLMRVFDIETKLIPLLLDMRFRGVRVDVDRAEEIQKELRSNLNDAKKTIRRLTGLDVDIWANDSVAEAFKEQGEWFPKTGTGKPSFRREWLEHNPARIATLIAEARRLSKLDHTFLQGHVMTHAVDGRIHTQFNQLKSEDWGTVSGRFSSSNPNLQQIPSRDKELAPLIRGLFIPEEGQDWWRADWSQIEYRFLVHYASKLHLRGARTARERYQDDPSTDFHQMCSELTGVDRKQAKNLNFGMVYGMGAEKLARSLGMSVEQAEPILNEYHARFPFARAMGQEASRVAARRGYIRTFLGRRRRFNTFVPSQHRDAVTPLRKDEAIREWGSIRRAGTHKALNGLIQGSAADQMKIAMVAIYESGALDVLGIPALTVHDELDGSKPRGKEGDEALAEVVRIMETCVELEVPVFSECETGTDWGHCEPWQQAA